MATTPETYKGNDALIQIGGTTHSGFGLSDFSLTLDRGTVEQELVGEEGNLHLAGSVSIEGSLTACKLDYNAAGALLACVISGTRTWISGSCGTNSLHFFFLSGMITGFDITMGDADTITEGSADFMVQDPQNLAFSYIGSEVWIKTA